MKDKLYNYQDLPKKVKTKQIIHHLTPYVVDKDEGGGAEFRVYYEEGFHELNYTGSDMNKESQHFVRELMTDAYELGVRHGKNIVRNGIKKLLDGDEDDE